MKLYVRKATCVSLAAVISITLSGSGSRAAAETTIISPFAAETSVSVPATTPLEPDGQLGDTSGYAVQAAGQVPLSAPASASTTLPAIPALSLERLVAIGVAATLPGELTGELKCLAGAIYFEARSESLEGQLAVGRVIIARTRSGRFPGSYCGVVYQPAQFSFMHRQIMPGINAQSPLWQRAVALARIADAGSWQSSAEGALFFHAARVSTNWRAKRIAQIDHHIFYR